MVSSEFASYAIGGILALIILNVLRQLIPRSESEPPLVFHWVPFVGNAVSYGSDPYRFLASCRDKHGDIFTFIMLGRKMTCYLGCAGTDFILNGKHSDLNAEDIYGPLTIPVFGSDVVYDCPNAKLMEQKRFLMYGLTQNALENHVPLIENEVLQYIKTVPAFKGKSGEIDIVTAMAEITLFTAARALQGEEVRKSISREMAKLYHDLDLGFQPINFVIPWAPLPANRRRDIAHGKMRAIYTSIIDGRRKLGPEALKNGSDMLWNLMRCSYKDGKRVPDKEIAHMMITMLMGGQHSSSSAGSWIMLRLATRPDVLEELYEEQVQNLANGRKENLKPLEYQDLDKLPLLHGVIKETLRMHPSITSILRKVTKSMPVPGTDYIVKPDKVLLAAPMVTQMDDEYFSNPANWDPHRWLSREDDDAKDTETVDYGYGAVSKASRSPYLPFGAGRHRCVGEKFAYVNLDVIIATLVREFKVTTVEGKGGVPETDYTSLISGPKRPAMIRWERRDGNASN